MDVSTAVREMPESGIREIVALAREVFCCVRLDLGEPHLPPIIIKHNAALSGETRYDRRWLAIYQRSGCGKDTESTTRCAGQSSYHHQRRDFRPLNALITTIEPGDEVLMPDPGWPVWEMMILAARGRPVRYLTPRANNFLPDPSELDRYVTPKTKAIIINTPSNPTGVVMPEETVKGMVEFARRNNLGYFRRVL